MFLTVTDAASEVSQCDLEINQANNRTLRIEITTRDENNPYTNRRHTHKAYNDKRSTSLWRSIVD